jgi:PAS domain S-box-containing protein
MKSGKKSVKPRGAKGSGRQPPRKAKPALRAPARKRAAAPPPLEQRAEIAHAFALAPAMVRALDGRILLWGGGLESLYGWSAAEAVGQMSRELLATTFPVPEAEIEAELRERGEWQGELERVHRDGGRLIVGSRWALHRGADGKPVSVVEFNLDLTEARQAQAMIQEREARLRSILETAPDAIITIDERGLMQSFSDAAEKLFGYAAGEAIGRNVSMLMSTPHREAHDGYLARYMRTGEKRIIGIGREVEARRKDGTTFPIELAVGEVKLGRTRIFTGFIRDLTVRVKMEQDLRQAQKMEAIGQLTGGVAHDFNNLLTVISGNLEMLEARLSGPDERELLEQAREACQLGAQLANRLLAFGRRQPLQPKLVDLAGLVGGMVDLLRRSLGATIAIETQLARGLPMVTVDPGQVENALLNLAVNARDAMPKGGKLMIAAAVARLGPAEVVGHPDQSPGAYVTLAVTDTGSGMTPEVRQRAFEPFFTTKGPGAGSGLGLSMVYGFVKQSGGHVQLDSEPGLGTTVRLFLPVRDDGAAAATQRQAVAPAAAARGETVLLVEDDARVRQVSHRRLRELGYAVLQAENGPAALKVLDDGAAIDLLFTDVVMPGGMTGVDLAHEARRRRPGLKILFTSGYADPGVLQDGLLTGGAGWLGKPYTLRELQAKLRTLLDR